MMKKSYQIILMVAVVSTVILNFISLKEIVGKKGKKEGNEINT